MEQAVAFSRSCGYRSVTLWTVSALTRAARLYLAAKFRKCDEQPGRQWGVEMVGERYELILEPSAGPG